MSFLDDFNNADTADTEFKEIENGTYTGKIKEASVDKTEEPWRVNFKWELVGGDFKGRNVFSNYTVDAKGGPWLKADLEKLGQGTDITADNLTVKVAQTEGAVKPIYVKKRTYTNKAGQEKTAYNVYVNDGEVGAQDESTLDNDEFGF